MNAKRYRLEGVRYSNGEVALQERPVLISDLIPVPTVLQDSFNDARNENQPHIRLAIGA